MISFLSSYVAARTTATGKVFFRPNPGNAGDALLNLGCITLLRQANIPFTLIVDSEDVLKLGCQDILVMSGGGNLVPYWSGGAAFLNSIVARRCSLILMPQSVLRCENELRLLSDRDVIFLRGDISFQYALSLNLEADVRLGDDCAFAVSPGVIRRLKPRAPRSVVECIRLAAIAYHLVRAGFRSHVAALRTDGESAAKGRRPKRNDLALLCKFGYRTEKDIEASVYWYLTILNRYKHVTTDRLHTMVGRVLLSKPVSVYPNDYYKIKEVIDLTIETNPKWRELVHFKGQE